GLTIATFCPTSALTRVDLPALGAPITATKPALLSPSRLREGGGGWVSPDAPTPLSPPASGRGESRKKRFGRRGFRLLLARPLGLGLTELRHAHANGEFGRVVRAGAADHLVDRRLAAACGGQLLQRRLGVMRGLALLGEVRLPRLADEALGCVNPAVEQQRAD